REYEGVESPECSRQHPGVEADPVHEIVDGKGGARIGAGLELAHVVADAGQAFETAVAIEEILHLRRRHALFRKQIQHDTGVELTRPRSHRKSVERGETHGAFDASAALDGAHRGPAAEMSDNDASTGDVRRDLR